MQQNRRMAYSSWMRIGNDDGCLHFGFAAVKVRTIILLPECVQQMYLKIAFHCRYNFIRISCVCEQSNQKRYN